MCFALTDWSYVFFPTTEVYRMSYPDLVNCMPHALHFVYTKASVMEQGWLKAEERKLNFKIRRRQVHQNPVLVLGRQQFQGNHLRLKKLE